MRALRLSCLLLISGLGSAGCHSLLNMPDGGHKSGSDLSSSVGFDMAVGDDLALSDAGPQGDMVCIPTLLSCAGLCGPIPDPCTGRNIECGGCAMNQVCNLATHICEVPKATCSDLKATCGNARNSCGTRLFCGDCAAGQQCNTDTNACGACQVDTSTPAATIASCQKLGFQCGQAWLGCGPRDNLSNCGTCPTGQTCNLVFNVCEKTCTPPDMPTACAKALANRGIQCGVIDDGCGGAIDCGGCASYGPGLGCGAQGDPGLCEPLEMPVECASTGRNCGTITSLCGGTIDCGKCMAPAVCNPNGVCGAPCTPLKCTDLKTPPQCGTVPDGCNGSLSCGNCPDATHYVCKPDHTCCKKKECAVDYKGLCGKGLDDGCGSTIDCTCASGSCNATGGNTGTCCVNTNSCPAGACNTSYVDQCTGATVPCGCGNNQWCDKSTTPGTCRDLQGCAMIVGHKPGQMGDQCSNGPAFDGGGGNLIMCPCGAGGICIPPPPPQMTPVTGNQIGVCCFNANTCAGKCNGTMVTNSCTGAVTTCNSCNGFCNSMNMCQPFKSCGTYGANGGPGQTCSNGPAFDNGNGGSLTCPCSGGRECSSGGVIVSGGTMGTCCTPPSCNGQCNVTLPDPCGGPSVVCPSNCGNGFFCGGNNMCQPLKTCANYQTKNPAGATGDACGTFSNGNGGTITCNCDTNPPFSGKNMCIGMVCTCTPNACTACTDNGTSNGCGTPLSCACPNGDPGHTICDPAGAAGNVDGFGCCQPYSPSRRPPTWPAAGPSGEPVCTPPISDGCGGSFSIPCPATNPNSNPQPPEAWPNVQCVAQPGGYGLCKCTPTACVNLPNPNGPNLNDGCGNAVNCHG